MGSCDLYRQYRPAHPCKVQLDDGQVRFMSEEAFEALFGVPFEPALALSAPRQGALRRLSEPPVSEDPATGGEPAAPAPLDVGAAPGVRGLPRSLWPREWAGGIDALGSDALAALGRILGCASCALLGGTVTAAWNPADLAETVTAAVPSLEGAVVLTPLDSTADGGRTDALLIDVPLGTDAQVAIASYLTAGTAPEEPTQTPAPASVAAEVVQAPTPETPEGEEGPAEAVPEKGPAPPRVVRARPAYECLPPETWPAEWRLGTATPPDPWCRGSRAFEEDVLRAVLLRGTPSIVGDTVCVRWSLPSLRRRFGRRGEGVADAVAALEARGVLERAGGDPSGTRTDRLFPGRALSGPSVRALEAYLTRGRVGGKARAYSEPVRDPRVTCSPGRECWGVPARLRPVSWSAFDGTSLSEDAVKALVWALCRARCRVVSGRVCAGIGARAVKGALGCTEGEARAVVSELQAAGALGPRESSTEPDGSVRGHNVRELFPKLPVGREELEEIEGAMRKGAGWGNKTAPMELPRFLSREASAKATPEPATRRPAGAPAKAPAKPAEEVLPTPAAEAPKEVPATPAAGPAPEPPTEPPAGEPTVLVFDTAGTFCGRLSEDDCRAAFGESCEISGGVCRVLPQGAPAASPHGSDDWSLARSQALALVAPTLLPRVEGALEAVQGGDAGVAAEISCEVRGHPADYRGSTAAAELMGAPVSPARLASRICHEAPYVALAVGALETLLERRGNSGGTGPEPPAEATAEAPGDVEGMCLSWAAAHTDDADLRRRHVARELSVGRWALLLFEEAASAAALEAALPCEHAPWDVTVVATEGFGATFAVALVETGGAPVAVPLGDGAEEASAVEAALAMAGLVCESGRRGPDGAAGEGVPSGAAQGVAEDGFIVCGQPARKTGSRGRLAHPRRSPRPHTVRGHWRNQACGPAWSEHRRIWVRQFEKGDTYAMGGESRPNAGHRVWRGVMACGLSVVA